MTTEQTAPSPDVDQLESALQVTERIIAGTEKDQGQLPTPCPDYDVSHLVGHLVGFATSFADKVAGVSPAADPAEVTGGDEPVAAYRDAADRLVAGYRAGPGEDATPIGVVLMETVTHGWDLARATGQDTPYDDDAVQAALGAGKGMLKPEFRGADKSFGDEVTAPPDSSPLDQLVAFMGRDPRWKA